MMNVNFLTVLPLILCIRYVSGHIAQFEMKDSTSAMAGHTALIQARNVEDITEKGLAGFVNPPIPHRNSQVYGKSDGHKPFSDWDEFMGPSGLDTAKTSNFRISGIRGRCGERVDALGFRYYSKTSSHLPENKDSQGMLYGGEGGRPNPGITHPNDVVFARVDARHGEYVAKVDFTTCRDDGRLCYIAFYSNYNNRLIFECGKRNGQAHTIDSGIYPNMGGRLYYMKGHAPGYIGQIQFVWAPSTVW